METQTVGQLVYKISGDMEDLKATLKKSEAEILKLKDEMDKAGKQTTKLGKGFINLGNVVKGFAVGVIAKTFTKWAKEGVELASQRYEQETRLAQILRVSTNATDDQIRSLKNQATELEKVGVVTRDVITASQAQLATFDLQADSIERLTPSIMDYLVAEKGVNATTGDAIALTNGLAQAINGNFASLTRTGFVLDEQTKKLISTGTEMERVSAIADVLDTTYNGMNETMAGTFLGTQKRVRTEFKNWKEDLGFAVMPALNVLGAEIIGLSSNLREGEERINEWGKTFHKVANTIVGISRMIGAAADLVISRYKVVESGITKVAILGTKLTRWGAKVIGKDTTTLDNMIENQEERIEKNTKSIVDRIEKMKTTWGKAMESFEEAKDPKNFTPISEATITAWNKQMGNTSQLANEFAESTEEVNEELDKFNNKMINLIDQAKSAGDALKNDLTKALNEFGSSIKDNIKETVEGMAGIVLGAENKIQDLKEQLSKTDDYDRRREIQNEIENQEKILKAREDYEERQAQRITAIREKLEEAGIDTSMLDNLLETRSLEEEIEEQRRLASLDEFTRFEEQQAKKLIILTDNLISEVSILREKIDKQEMFEAELTDFLLSEDKKRLENTDEWVNQTLAKYQDVANSLKSLLSLESQIGRLGPVSQVSPTIPESPTSVSGGVTNTTNISAPVTINGQSIQNLTAQELSAIMGFELRKEIR